MSLKRQRRKLNSKSQEIQEILAERLNKLCRFLDEEYDVNCGGCCYIAYCLARLLSRDKFKFKVIIYEDYELEEKFSEVARSHYHYAISIGKYAINAADCDDDDSFCRNVYTGVKASELLSHYQKCSWNDCYNTQKNQFIFKTIKVFYDDLTEDLREG